MQSGPTRHSSGRSCLRACGPTASPPLSLGVSAMKKITVFGVVVVVLFVMAPGVHLVENAWLLLVAHGFSVPKASSMVTFQCTVISDGSGEYCEFGQDRNSYYAACVLEGGQHPKCDTDFLSYKKSEAIQCQSFSPHDFRTWCHHEQR